MITLALLGAIIIGIGTVAFVARAGGKSQAKEDAQIADLKRAEETHAKAAESRAAVPGSDVVERLRADGRLRD